MVLNDRFIIYTASFLRALGFGMLAVLFGIYLAKINFTPPRLDLSSAQGGTSAVLVVTYLGDFFGRRLCLISLALISAVGGLVIALGSNFIIITTATFIGMLNSMGRDRGASLTLEQAILPATTTNIERTKVFA